MFGRFYYRITYPYESWNILFKYVQLSDAVSVIGREDFPLKWPDLLSQMVAKFGCQVEQLPEGAPPVEPNLVPGYRVTFLFEPQLPVICGVLLTAYSLFQHYAEETRSTELYEEILLVLKQFAAPFTALFEVRVPSTSL